MYVAYGYDYGRPSIYFVGAHARVCPCPWSPFGRLDVSTPTSGFQIKQNKNCLSCTDDNFLESPTILEVRWLSCPRPAAQPLLPQRPPHGDHPILSQPVHKRSDRVGCHALVEQHVGQSQGLCVCAVAQQAGYRHIVALLPVCIPVLDMGRLGRQLGHDGHVTGSTSTLCRYVRRGS